MIKTLPRKNSDHKGILVSLSDFNWGPNPFGVFNIWLQEDSLKWTLFTKLSWNGMDDAQSLLRAAKNIIKT